MEYLTLDEMDRLLNVARAENELHWQAIVAAFYFGLRVSELCAIQGEDISDGLLTVKRLKRSLKSTLPIPRQWPTANFECRLEALAKAAGLCGRVFPLSRQRCDQFMKRYSRLAGIHRGKAHFHALKHATAMAIWKQTHQPGQIKAYLGHRSMSSTIQYLNEEDSQQAALAMAGLSLASPS